MRASPTKLRTWPNSKLSSLLKERFRPTVSQCSRPMSRALMSKEFELQTVQQKTNTVPLYHNAANHYKGSAEITYLGPPFPLYAFGITLPKPL